MESQLDLFSCLDSVQSLPVKNYFIPKNNQIIDPVIGQKFYRLTAISCEKRGVRGGGRHYLFRCECGQEKVCRLTNVTSGMIKSCGCARGGAKRKNCLSTAPGGKDDPKIGKKIEKLTAISYEGKNKWNKPLYLFKCECGEEKVYPWNAVAFGGIKSCGCMRVNFYKNGGGYKLKTTKLIDISGQTFGELFVTGKTKVDGKRTLWECLCSCDGVLWTDSTNLRNGLKTHCGCKTPPKPEPKIIPVKLKPIDWIEIAKDAYCWIKDGYSIRVFAREQGFRDSDINQAILDHIPKYREASIKRREESAWKKIAANRGVRSKKWLKESDFQKACEKILNENGVEYKPESRRTTGFEIDILTREWVCELKIATEKKTLYRAIGQVLTNSCITGLQPVIVFPSDCRKPKAFVEVFKHYGIITVDEVGLYEMCKEVVSSGRRTGVV